MPFSLETWPLRGILTLIVFGWMMSASAQNSFTKMTEGPLVTDLSQSIACSWGDYDGDGWLDVFIANSRANPDLYRNDRAGGFLKVENRLTQLGLSGPGSWADYDNDGDLDMFVCNLRHVGNWLYRNDGLGGFNLETSGSAGSIVHPAHSVSASLADYDNDGLLDVFVANGALLRSERNFLHRNLGGGKFADQAAAAGLAQALQSNRGVWADIDNDGDMDLFVTNYGQGNQLYINRGNGTFDLIFRNHALAETAYSTGAAWGDYDNDGYFDLCVANHGFQRAGAQPILLYRNLGNGQFEKVVDTVISQEPGQFISCAWGDYDNDGWVDLFVTNDHEQNPSLLFRNNGDGIFSKAPESPVIDRAPSAGCAWADYGNDGFLDLLVVNGGIVGPQRNFLYRNNGNDNHWLKLRLRGTVSNRSAIGAKVRVRSEIDGETIWQLRQVSAGEGWFSQGPLEIAFGLGDAETVEVVRIEWPSGQVQELKSVRADQILMITEPSDLSWKHEPNGARQISVLGGVNNSYRLEASNDLKTWSGVAVRSSTAPDGLISFDVPAEPDESHQFYRSALSQVALLAAFKVPDSPDELPELPEGLAVDREGNVYVGIITTGEIRKITPAGGGSKLTQFEGMVAGMDTDPEGNLYVCVTPMEGAATELGIWRISSVGEVELFAAMPEGTLLNDVVVGASGGLFVTDSIGGSVLRISPEGAVETWVSHELLLGIPDKPAPLPPFPIGANGIAFANGSAFVSNTDRGTLTRIPVNPDGSAGTPVLFLEDPRLNGADGVVADSLGNLYVANIAQTTMLHITPKGEISIIADVRDGLDGPSSLRFGRRLGEEGTIFFVNYAYLSAYGGGEPKPSLMKLPLGIAGASAP